MLEDAGQSSSKGPRRGESPGATRRPDSPLVQQAVQRAKEGDREALHFLYVRFAPDLNRHVNSIVGDRHEANGIVQSVFAELVTGTRTYGHLSFTAWILGEVRNAALDHMRGRRAVPTEEIQGVDFDTTGHIAGRLQPQPGTAPRFEELRHALNELRDDQREVLVLKHVMDLSTGEIADALGKSESSIHGLHHSGRRRLKSTLRDRGVAPTSLAF